MYMEGQKVEGRDEEDEVQGVNEENGQGSVIPLAPVNKGWIFPPMYSCDLIR